MPRQPSVTPSELRDWLVEKHGTDYGAPDDALAHYIDRAEAKRRALNWGSVYVMAATMVREVSEGPKP